MKPVIIWFRQDLRLQDNPAFYEAAQLNIPVIPLYILDDTTPGIWRIGRAQRVWLHQNLFALQKKLQSIGLSLILRRGESQQILRKLIKEVDAVALYWNACYEPYFISLDQQIESVLQKKSIQTKIFTSHVLSEPANILNQSGQYFKIFTAFWRAHQNSYMLSPPYPTPKKVKPFIPQLQSSHLEQWKLCPSKPNWAIHILNIWPAGEKAAKIQLKRWLNKGSTQYAARRDYPAEQQTSRLSPYLHLGIISPRQVFYAVVLAEKTGKCDARNAEKFLSELGWREFSYYFLFHFPQFATRSFKSAFEYFPWENQKYFLERWQKGETGYPLVDAGMRELWQTGFMHNRVRMITASFLTKNLLMDWRVGAKWFWDTLIDADLASNSMGWQWVAGSGVDASPYFRIFNPILQGKKFDPLGVYVKRWVPELAKVPIKFIHQPWLWEGFSQLNYPAPIVSHETARKKALMYYQRVKS